MSKLVLAAVLACSTFGGMTNQGPSITLNPMPPHAGDTMNIQYSGTLPAVLTVTPDPGTPFTIRIASRFGYDLAIGTNWSSLVVSDPNGGAPAEPTVVLP